MSRNGRAQISASSSYSEAGGPAQWRNHAAPTALFWLSEPDKIDDGAGDWGFTIFADKDVFLATVSYVTQADAMRGPIAMAEALKDAIHLATSKR